LKVLTKAASSGVGKATAEALILHNPTHIYLLCRNLNKGEAVCGGLRTIAPNVIGTVLPCNLSSFQSIRAAAAEFSLLASRLDILICNAGIYMPTPSLTQEGYEAHFGVNHLGHALLIKLLLPTLHRTAALEPKDVRVIFVASAEHKWAPRGSIIFDDLKTTQPKLTHKQRYAQSKLANTLYAREMSRRYPDFTVVSLHPGYVATNKAYDVQKRYLRLDTLVHYFSNISTAVYRQLGGQMLTPREGSQLSVWCASAVKNALVTGEYYDSVNSPGTRTELARDDTLAIGLWSWTQAVVTAIPFDENTIREPSMVL
jgi:retinol dehydrogenase-12